MRTCAVVLNWHDDARTMRCIESLRRSEEVEHVFVVDNETSKTLGQSLANFSPVPDTTTTLIELRENRGFAAGVNEAIKLALAQGFDAVLLINNDATIEPESTLKLRAELARNPRLGIVSPRIVHLDGSEESAGGFLSPLRGTTTHKRSDNRPPDFLTWACVLVRSSTLHEVGLLDEQFFMYWEDVDYSLRAKAASWQIAVCSEASATHETSTNRKSFPVAIKAYHTWSGLRFARKHGGNWRVGAYVWIVTSGLANVVRLRRGALSGLYTGWQLAREGANPAYTSTKRKHLFAARTQQ